MKATSGHNYHVEVSGEGTPILLLHGFTGDTTTWNNVRRELELTCRVIAVDILGHGDSDKPPTVASYHMEQVGDDMISLLEELAVGQVHLLGYSMGGRLALYLAIHHPQQFLTLILESASPGLATEAERDERKARDDALAAKIEANGISWFVDFWESLSLWDSQKALSDSVRVAQRAQRLRNDSQGLANSLRGMGTGVQPALWDALPTLNLPTKLIVGAHDEKFIRINQEMVSLIPNASMDIIDDAGHTVHLENLEAFTECVREFLRPFS